MNKHFNSPSRGFDFLKSMMIGRFAARRLSFWLMTCLVCTPIFQPAIFAQEQKIKWGEVPRADLEMKSFADDSNATAVVLYDFGKVSFSVDFDMTFERHRRIKILTEGGYDWADVSIQFYAKNRYQRVGDVEGQTISFGADGSLVKTKLEKNAIFNEDVDGERRRIRFSLPKLSPGAIIEYRYKLYSSNPTFLHDWEFQTSEPTRWSEFIAEIPGALQYVRVTQNVMKFDVEEADEQSWYQSSSYKIMRYRWVMQNLPALREEPFMTTVDDHLAKISFQLAKIFTLAGPRIDVMNTWEKLAEDLIDSPSFGKQIERHKILKQTTESLVAGLSDPKAKMLAIYDHIQKNIVWNEERGIYTDVDLDKAYAARRAGGPEIALMLCSMFRSAGLESYPVLISTRSNGRIIQIYSILSQFNHVVTLVNAGGDTHLLDATDPLRPYTLLPVQALNEVGWLVDKKTPAWVDIVSPGAAFQNTIVNATITAEGTVGGRIVSSESGYRALFSRKDLRDKKGEEEEYVRDTWLKDFSGAQVDTFYFTNRDSISLPLISNVIFSNAELAQVAGDNIYLNPMFFHRQSENPFKLPNRSFPVDYAYGRKIGYSLDLFLPEGYAVQDKPADLSLALNNNGGLFRRKIEANGNRLHVEYVFMINRVLFNPPEYKNLQEFYNRIVAGEAEQVVLKRSNPGQEGKKL